MTDEAEEGTWVWERSKKVLDWSYGDVGAPGQPDNWKEEHCVHVKKDDFTLNDIKCSGKSTILCEKSE